MAHQYRMGAKVDAFDENLADHQLRLMNYEDECRRIFTGKLPFHYFFPTPTANRTSEYMARLPSKRKASLSLRIMACVCAAAAAAVLVELFPSDGTQDILVNVRASMAAFFAASSATAKSDPSPLTSLDTQNATALSSEAINQAFRRSFATAAEPAREELKMVYQSAPQGGAPGAEPVAELTTPADAIHHLDPDVIASLRRRADALMASGDIAAARLVLVRAAEAGDAGAAMTFAGTYDPVNLTKLGVHGIVPDVALARSWYNKAKNFGSAEAPQRLEMLASKRE